MPDTAPTPDLRLEPALACFKAAVIANGLTEKHFLPPVPAERVQGVFNELDLPLHPDIATLYAWSEGYNGALGPPHRFFPGWHMEALEQAVDTREIMAQIFDEFPDEADLWPVASISHATLCVHTVDGTLWESPKDEEARQLNPITGQADMFDFWAHLHETGYYQLVNNWWIDEYDRGLRDFGTNWHPLQEYA